MRRWGTTFLVLLIVSTATMQSLMACPNCKEGLLESGQSGANLARGFELSIYLMLAAPLLILTTLATVFYFQIRSAKKLGKYPNLQQVIARAEAQPLSSSSV